MQENKLDERRPVSLVVAEEPLSWNAEAPAEAVAEQDTKESESISIPGEEIEQEQSADSAVDKIASTPAAGAATRKLEILGTVIDGRYELISLLGAGGMSKVFKANDLLSQCQVAVKLITPERLRDPKSVERFKQEAKLVSLLSHANIAPTREFGQDADGTPYLVMDYIEGVTLTELCHQQQIIPPDRATKIMLQICEGLKQAHARAIIHRDLKPSNVMLTSSESGEDHVHILDFGIARVFEEAAGAHIPMTETSEMLGTPWYMSPEQCFGQAADQRSDVYQLGCLFYELLSGRKAFEGVNAFEVMFKHVTGTPGLEGIAGDTRSIVERALAKSPEQRYQNVEDLIKDLQTAYDRCDSSKREHYEKTRFNEFISQSAESLGKVLPRRLGAAAIDSLLITTTLVLVTIVLYAANLAEGYTNTDGWPRVYFEVVSAIKLGLVDSFMVWPAAFLSLIPDQFLFWRGGLSDYCPFLREFHFNCRYLPFVLLLTNWLYHSLFESSKLGATPGKILCGLAVRTGVAQTPSFLTATKRHFGKIISLTFLPELIRFLRAVSNRGIGAARMQLAQQLQTPIHDRLSKCAVTFKTSKSRKVTGLLLAALTCLLAVPGLPWALASMNRPDLALKIDANFALALEQQAGQSIRRYKFKEALADLSAVQKKLPSEWRIYAKEVAVYCQLHDTEGAIAALKNGIKNCDLNGPTIDARDVFRLNGLLASILASQGKFKESLATLQQVPTNWVDPIFRAYLYRLTGDEVEAKEHFKNAEVDNLPYGEDKEHDRVYIYQDRAIALAALGNESEALKSNEHALADCDYLDHHGQHSGYLVNYMGGSAYLLHANLTSKISPDKASVRSDYEKAISHFTKFIKTESGGGFDNFRRIQEIGKAYLGRAQAYEGLGDRMQALADRNEAKKRYANIDLQCTDERW